MYTTYSLGKLQWYKRNKILRDILLLENIGNYTSAAPHPMMIIFLEQYSPKCFNPIYYLRLDITYNSNVLSMYCYMLSSAFISCCACVCTSLSRSFLSFEFSCFQFFPIHFVLSYSTFHSLFYSTLFFFLSPSVGLNITDSWQTMLLFEPRGKIRTKISIEKSHSLLGTASQAGMQKRPINRLLTVKRR